MKIKTSILAVMLAIGLGGGSSNAAMNNTNELCHIAKIRFLRQAGSEVHEHLTPAQAKSLGIDPLT